MFPIRCFTCGALLADKWEEYERRVKAGEHPRDVLDSMGIHRYCCRRMFLSHIKVIDRMLEYEIYPFSLKEEIGRESEQSSKTEK